MKRIIFLLTIVFLVSMVFTNPAFGYTSVQIRVQVNTLTPWSTSTQAALGETIHIGVFKNGWGVPIDQGGVTVCAVQGSYWELINLDVWEAWWKPGVQIPNDNWSFHVYSGTLHDQASATWGGQVDVLSYVLPNWPYSVTGSEYSVVTDKVNYWRTFSNPSGDVSERLPGFYITKGGIDWNWDTCEPPAPENYMSIMWNFEEMIYDSQWIYLVRDTSWTSTCIDNGHIAGMLLFTDDNGQQLRGARHFPRFLANGGSIVADSKYIQGVERKENTCDSDAQECRWCDAQYAGGPTSSTVQVELAGTVNVNGHNLSDVLKIRIIGGSGTGDEWWFAKDKGLVKFTDGNQTELFDGWVDYPVTIRTPPCYPDNSSMLDLCFVIDSSGSMWDDIANVKNSMETILTAIVDQVEEGKIDDYRIAIVDFQHYYYSTYATRAALDFTNDTYSILSAINSLSASGGADPGEAVFAGLMCAFTNCSFGAGSGMSPWRDDALKIAILLGDEPPYTGSQEFTFEQVVAAAEAGGSALSSSANSLTTEETSTTDGIHIYSILIGSNSTAKYYFKKLAEETGGQFFNALTANDVVDAILEAIGSIPGPGPGPTNSAPDVSGATASVSNIWPPNNKMIDIQILDVVDPDGDPVTITITAITQDEPVNQTGSKKKEPDAEGIGTDTAWVRAERDGNGNGRVYEITFEASDDKGATAEGSVFVCVPHDQGEDIVCINDGQNYDSTSFK